MEQLKKIVNYIVGLYFYMYNFFNNKSSEKKRESLIVTDTDIKILETTLEDSKNLLNYLRHHIMYTDDTFENIYFEDPIFVKFKYLNETYQICLKKLESTKDDHAEIIKNPPPLVATIRDPSDSDKVTHDITEKLRELHGSTKNFFKHIPDAEHELSDILKEHSGKELHVFDAMGCSIIRTI